jgi:hypothetical protein
VSLAVDHQVQRGVEGTGVYLRRRPRQHGQWTAVGALGQFDHVPIAQTDRGVRHKGGQVDDVEPGRVGSFAPHPRVVTCRGTPVVLRGRLVVRDHGNRRATGERQVVEHAPAPAGQLRHHAVVHPDAAQLRAPASRRVRQVEDRRRVR